MTEPSFSDRDLQKLSLLRLRDLHNDLAKEKTSAKSAAKTWLLPLLLGNIAGCFASMCLSSIAAYLINPKIVSGTAESPPAVLTTAFFAFIIVLALTFTTLRRWRRKKDGLAINSREAALASAVQEVASQQPGWTTEVGGVAALLDARRVEALLSLIDGGQKTTAAPTGALQSGTLMGNQQHAGQIKQVAPAGEQVAAGSVSNQAHKLDNLIAVFGPGFDEWSRHIQKSIMESGSPSVMIRSMGDMQFFSPELVPQSLAVIAAGRFAQDLYLPDFSIARTQLFFVHNYPGREKPTETEHREWHSKLKAELQSHSAEIGFPRINHTSNAETSLVMLHLIWDNIPSIICSRTAIILQDFYSLNMSEMQSYIFCNPR